MTPTRTETGASRAVPARVVSLSSALLLAVALGSVSAQTASTGSEDPAAEARTRIWGRVTTVSGQVHEGFLRWDRNEASWVDLLNGSKSLARPEAANWRPQPGSGIDPADRVIEFGGYRITWDDDDANFSSTAESGVRFGHLSRIRVLGGDSVSLEMRSGEAVGLGERDFVLLPGPNLRIILEGGSTDLGADFRGLVVDEPGRETVSLAWEDLAEVELGSAPEEARPRQARLHGTVEDRWGNRYTGYVAWDSDQALASDTLGGRELGGRDRKILFGEVRSIEPTVAGAFVTLVRGDSLRLVYSGDVDAGTDLQVSDPGLGQVTLKLRDVERLLFHPPEPPVGGAIPGAWDSFDGGRPLRGTVVTETGAELSGLIKWDSDEELSWEILDGNWEDVTFDVEMGMVAAIEKIERERGVRSGARVTLRDGRILELSGSNDVDTQNKGVLVRPDDSREAATEGPDWIRVRWPDFRSLRFHR